ncbi:transcriptional regulator ATRX homolog [Melanaphis sacchari]|uniref:transcriptional regulator ATRX homolog n=1 Tax=Melanaphis sacchari TaxID=742174 RepID=UPI000DC1401A|nr:transcriptional regulator ATRX homolog [Melanaphis sacchari]
MAPRKKATQKPAKSSIEDVPPIIVEDMSHITVRRPITKDNMIEDEVIQKDEIDVKTSNSEINMDMNATVVLERIPDFQQQEATEVESELDLVVNEEEPIKKPVQKKISKSKLKSKKQTAEEDSRAVRTRKRAASEDRQALKAEEKVVSKSRKRPVDKNLPESLKPVSPLNELPKRNRRAASVDIITSESSSHPLDKVSKKNKVTNKSTKAAIVVTEDDELKKQKKGTKKDQPKIMEIKDDETKILEKNSKGKKNTKKVLNEEKENVVTEQNDGEFVLNGIQGKPKSKRGVKNVKLDEIDQDEENKVEKVTKPSSRSRAAPKVMAKQNNEKDLEKKQKNVPKTKKNIKSPEKSEESSEINESDDSNKTPEIKPKRERKFKQIDVEKKDDEFKEIKAPKRGGRKAKVEDLDDEVLQKSPPTEHEIYLETEDLADDLPHTPESKKKEVKPIAKRKTKAKSKK